MLFFQILLLGGYAYAHAITRLQPKAQALLHLLLLIAALILLPIIPSDSWKPKGTENPTVHILLLLTVSLGLPYFVLSTTGPLIQHWFMQANPGRSPYRLYALSNIGSLLALISYPFYFESHFTRKTQASMWGWALAAYVASCAMCIKKLWSTASPQSGAQGKSSSSLVQSSEFPSADPACSIQHQASGTEHSASLSSPVTRPSSLSLLLWFLLPACASILLLATTNKMCQDVAVIPFLWILPLALYLLTFIICFDSPRWYVRFPFVFLLLGAFAAISWALTKGEDASIYKQLSAYCAGLFICAMVCHGELYRLRPAPERLTAFYLMIAAGGAFGGIFVACIAPVIFKQYYELQLGLVLCAVLTLITWAREPFVYFSRRITRPQDFRIPSENSDPREILPPLQRSDTFGHVPWIRARALLCGLLVAVTVALAVNFWSQLHEGNADKILVSRNFYGVLTVFEHHRDEPNEHHFLLQHGRITHGLQFVDPEEAAWPTTYYGEDSGVGLAMRALPPQNRRIGLVGLGTGTLASYGKSGDVLHIYEINPAVRGIASTNFAYVSHSPAQVEIALGDARLSMEREPPQRFDLLALDAFSGDAIPVHLLTEEAFQIYQRHLNTNAILAVHISNHYLDLEPIVANLAKTFDYRMAVIDYDETDEEWWLYSSTWILLTRNPEILNATAIQNVSVPVKSHRRPVAWTDDFTSLYQILK
jgi:nitrate/nitrite transporter NarK